MVGRKRKEKKRQLILIGWWTCCFLALLWVVCYVSLRGKLTGRKVELNDVTVFCHGTRARGQEQGQLVGKSAGLVIETFQVRIPAGEYSYPELTLCADSYSVSIPPHVTAVARKRPRSFCQKSAGGRFHPNTHTLFTQRSRFGLTMPLSRHSVGTYPETGLHATCQGTLNQSSQLAEPLWTDPGIKSGTSVRELISPPPKKKKRRNAQVGSEWSFSKNPHKRGKSHDHQRTRNDKHGLTFALRRKLHCLRTRFIFVFKQASHQMLFDEGVNILFFKSIILDLLSFASGQQMRVVCPWQHCFFLPGLVKDYIYK